MNRKISMTLVAAAVMAGMTGCSGLGGIKNDVDADLAEKTSPKLERVEKTAKIEPLGKPDYVRGRSDIDRFKAEQKKVLELKRFTIQAHRSSVKTVLRKLARDAGIQLVMYPFRDKRVTVNLRDVPSQVVVDTVCDQAGLDCYVKDGVMFVSKSQPRWEVYSLDYVNIVKKSSAKVKMTMAVGSGATGTTGGTGKSGTRSSSTEVETVSEQDIWKDIQKSLTNIVKSEWPEAGDDAVVVSKETGLVSVYGNQKVQRSVKKFLDKFKDHADRQVLIEASVVEVELNDENKAGIDWSSLRLTNATNGALPNGFFASIVGDPNKKDIAGGFNFSFGINFLSQFGKTRVVSTPKIMAMNNQTAVLKVVENQVYFTTDVQTNTTQTAVSTVYQTQVHSVPVGFMMSVTPFVSKKGDVVLNIRPTISRIVGYVEDPNPSLKSAGVVSQIPVIQEKEISSVLRLKDGQVAILGGLMRDERARGGNGLPGIVDAGKLGDLTAYKETKARKTELVIFLRPLMVNKPDIDKGDLKIIKKEYVHVFGEDESEEAEAGKGSDGKKSAVQE